MVNYNDEDLFNACMNFCQIYGIFLIKKSEIENNRFLDGYDKRDRLRYYKEMLMSRFEHLHEVVNSIESDLND